MSQQTAPSRPVLDAPTRPDAPVLIIGLDGATFTVLDPLLADGTMPRLAGMIGNGRRAVMSSTPHPLSPPAWASIITGYPPGDHGIFDFVRVDHSTGDPAYTLISAADLRSPTIFELADRAGLTVTALNFPAMFPPPRIRGSVVPGYVPSSYLARACWPRNLYAELVSGAGLRPAELAVDWELERTAVQGLEPDELTRWVDLHIQRERQWAGVAEYLMRRHPADLTAVVLDGVDRIQHLCLHLLLADPDTLDAAQRRTRDRCIDYFRLVDDIIGRLVDLAGPDTTVLIVSDHGSERAGDRIFYANVWLEQQGLLRWADGVPVDQAGRLAMNGNAEVVRLFDWTQTSAAALTSSSNAIVVHRAAAPGQPGIPADEYGRFCRRLAEDLLTARDPVTGDAVVDRVLLRDDTFAGRFCEEAPDLTLVLKRPGFLSVLRGPDIVAPRRTPHGTHHPNGIFVAAGPGMPPEAPRGTDTDGPAMSLLDVAPTVLDLLGLPVPAGMPGTAPAGAGAIRRRAGQAGPARVEPADAGPHSEPAFDPDGEAEIMARLRRLGYLE
jgi:predicted AlkP superfamily phosphohydrolase/phosphomutase